MPSVCELKIELKAKGIKGITGLNKAGLEALLKTGKAEAVPHSASKDRPKAKTVSHSVSRERTFTPAPTKGESPKVAEKKITKKERVPKILRLTYKPETVPVLGSKPPPKLKKSKQTEDERLDMLNTKIQSTKCVKLMKKAGLKTITELKQYIIKNHPDKLKNYDPSSAGAILYKELSNCATAYKNMKIYLASGAIKGFKGLPPD
jgi:hypothetical protein